MVIAGAAVLVVWRRGARRAQRGRIQQAMNLFVGVMLMVMGIGHLFAVTTTWWQGTVNGSPALLFVIGGAVVIPATALVLNASRAGAPWLNAWTAATLVLLGLVNIPLALPALLNIAYSRHTRPITGWTIVAATVVIHIGLFAGGMMFMLSGARTFEEFTR
jgi:hypothetical protein